MVSRERIERMLEGLTQEDLDAVAIYLNRLQAAGKDPVRRAFVRSSILPPEKMSPEERAALELALADDTYYSREELTRLLDDEAPLE